ncbi:MAG: hypothetical protein ACTHN5_15985 [Phycisphaerae bacterium]
MSAIPSVLSSARTVLDAGFSKLDRAGAKIASAVTGQDGGSSNGGDPIVSGVVDTFEAREDVGAGVALMNTYQRMSDDLIEMSDPRPRSRYIDLYA